METTTQKFSCKNDGCTMTFTCEDQLVAHEKRHEMVLNLGPLKANLFNSRLTYIIIIIITTNLSTTYAFFFN